MFRISILLMLLLSVTTFGSIVVIDTIEPKNDAFDVLVEIDHLGFVDPCDYSLFMAGTDDLYSELKIGTANQYIKVNGSANGYSWDTLDDSDMDFSGWTGINSITTLGTIGTGTWEGTDVGVEHGGTGASTLTDGGVLLGSGTGDVTPMAVLADGEFIVGDGTTDPVAESGDTARTSLGLGTGDSPAFAGLDVDTLNLNGNDITDSTGTIDFVDENLTTSGTLGAGVATLATGSTIGNLTLGDGSITDSSGAISFNDENLTTTGTLNATGLETDTIRARDSLTDLVFYVRDPCDPCNATLEAGRIDSSHSRLVYETDGYEPWFRYGAYIGVSITDTYWVGRVSKGSVSASMYLGDSKIVVEGTAPTLTADNFSDGGSNAIVTTTQETNWDNHIADNSQAHSDYLKNDAADSMDGTLTITANNDIALSGTGRVTSGSEGFIIGSAAVEETELEILDGATVTTTELNYLDGTTLGTAVASKVLAVDASKDIDLGTGDFSAADIRGTKIEVDGATEYIDTSGGDLVFYSSVVSGGLALVELSCPPIVSVEADTQSENDYSIDVGTDYFLLLSIDIETSSTDWTFTLYSKSDYSTKEWVLVNKADGDYHILNLNFPYEDEDGDAGTDIHFNFTDNDGSNTFDYEIKGYKLRSG